ncbi:MAG: hypothetical protein OEM05_10710 [Myxococcales bacterium]|nr:hypothetical protein [Myxococcales bacterium]
MSTILKALRRLEEEKALQAPRPLREQVATRPATRRGLGRLAAGLAVCAGVAIGAAAFLLWPQLDGRLAARLGEEAGPADGEAVAALPAAVQEPPRSVARAADPPPVPPASTTPTGAEGTSDLSPAALASRVEVVESVAPPPGPREARVAAVVAPAPEAFRAPAPLPDPSPARRDAIAAGSDRSRPPPSAPSKLARTFVPSVVVVRTVWHPTAERRMAEVEVEGRPAPLLLHEGDAVGPLVVSEIEPSGVVFLHDEVELRRRVGNR